MSGTSPHDSLSSAASLETITLYSRRRPHIPSLLLAFEFDYPELRKYATPSLLDRTPSPILLPPLDLTMSHDKSTTNLPNSSTPPQSPFKPLPCTPSKTPLSPPRPLPATPLSHRSSLFDLFHIHRSPRTPKTHKKTGAPTTPRTPVFYSPPDPDPFGRITMVSSPTTSFPPTPALSLDCDSQRSSLVVPMMRLGLSLDTQGTSVAGPSRPAASYRMTPELPMTPPEPSGSMSPIDTSLATLGKQSGGLSFAEPNLPSRRRTGRRPPSGYPLGHGVAEHESLQSEDDASDVLDVDIDAYSMDPNGSEVEEPALSYAPSSMYDSTTGTPSTTASHAYHLGLVTKDGDPLPVRLRAPSGRSHAYSSAESSVVSSSSVYNQYGIVHHPHPPPVPALPAPGHRGLGLGIINHDYHPGGAVDDGEPYGVPRWRRDVVDRSATPSTSSPRERRRGLESPASISWDMSYDYHAKAIWDEGDVLSPGPTAALAMVADGTQDVLDLVRIQALGGLEELSEEMLPSFAGVTHLLLPSVGSHLVNILPSLLSIVAPTVVVVDLSDNDLSFVPEEIQQCALLEELNLSGNPVRQLPRWIGSLVSLRMFQADSCSLHVLPEEMACLENLHTLCIRENRLVALPAWVHVLSKLSILRLDDNWFAPQWQAIVAPMLRNRRSVPSVAQHSVLRGMSRLALEHDDLQSPTTTTSAPSRCTSGVSQQHDGQRMTAVSYTGSEASSPSPSGAQFAYTQPSLVAIVEDTPQTAPIRTPVALDRLRSTSSNSALRKMRSAGDLLGRSRTGTPARPPHNRADSTTAVLSSSSNVTQTANGMLSPTSSVYSPLTAPASVRVGRFGSTSSPRRRQLSDVSEFGTPVGDYQPRPDSKSSSSGRSSKWGFLRKMSMNKLRPEKEKNKVALLQTEAADNVKLMPVAPLLKHMESEPVPLAAGRPTLPPRSASVIPTNEDVPTNMEDASAAHRSGLPPVSELFGGTRSVSRGKRRSFLPVDGPPNLTLNITDQSPLVAQGFFSSAPFGSNVYADLPETLLSDGGDLSDSAVHLSPENRLGQEERYAAGLAMLKSYLRDLYDLGRPAVEPYGALDRTRPPGVAGMVNDATPTGVSITEARHRRRATMDGSASDDAEIKVADLEDEVSGRTTGGKAFKDNRQKRTRILREIYETERTYVRGLGELVAIYVKPAAQTTGSSKGQSDTVVPLAERKAVFGGIESIFSMHKENLLPALEQAVKTLIEKGDDEEGVRSIDTAHLVGDVFRTYIAYMKQYSTYVNNFDTALTRMKEWAPSSAVSPLANLSGARGGSGGPSISAAAVGMGMGMGGVSVSAYDTHAASSSASLMTTSQRKRVKTFMKKCKEHPMHSQINLEAYLLLPIQRVPRYRLLLEDLALCTPPAEDRPRDTLDDALAEIASLASLMNEEKRDAESRLRLFNWQQRLTVKFQSPLVQPHRKLVLDGTLNLIRVAKRETSFIEIDNTSVPDADTTIGPGHSDKVMVPVDFIKPEPMDKEVTLILCSDMMVLVTKHGEAWDGPVDLFGVLRMGTLREPASMVNQDVLRVVDNRSIYYFSGPDPATTLQWCRAINIAKMR